MSHKGDRGGYGLATGRGIVWMLVSTLITKSASFIAQIVLGWILLKEEFGLWAIALSVTSFLQILKDGGTRKIIVQKGVGRFDRLCAPVFWIATAFNLATALVIVALAWPAAGVYESPDLVSMMLIIALGTALGSPDMMYRAKLTVDMRYRELSRFQTLSGLVRFGSTILLAVLGFGAASLAWPVLVQALFGWMYGRMSVGVLPIWGPLKLRMWPIFFHATMWMLVGAGGLTALRMGPYSILGLMHPPEVLAIYFFAYQLLVQIDVLIAYNLQSVLLPTLSAIKENHERHRAAVLRSIGTLSLAGACAGMGFGVCVEDAVRFIWADKWVESSPAVQWMAVFFAFRMLQAVLEPALLSRGLYREWAWLMVLQGVIVSLVSVLIGFWFERPWEFALFVGIGFTISMACAGCWAARIIGLRVGSVLLVVLRPWSIVLGVYALVILARWELGFGDEASRLVLLARGSGSAAVFVVAVVLALRLVLPNDLRTTLEFMPAPIKRRVSKVLCFGAPGSHRGGRA